MPEPSAAAALFPHLKAGTPEPVQRRKRLKAEVEAFEADKQAQGQAQLDAFWRSKIEAELEYRQLLRELNPTGLRIWG
jgi:hypothetical protein